VTRRRRTDLLVLAGYAGVSFAYFGWRLLPHPGRLIAGFGGDAEILIWSFAWWPHALGTFTNPFVSNAIYAPTGVNLTWTATAPGLALLFSPLTALVGPVASYNVAAVLAPAAAAWTAYLLCRRLTGSVWGSLVGGYLFGFSAAVLRQQLFGHLHQTAIFVVPLVALVVVRFVEGDLDGRGLVWRLGVLLAAQLWLSTELTLTLTLMLAIGLTLAAAHEPAAPPPRPP
jgi:dolichyl-phosphate beta-glucosyltransferase